MPVDEFAARAAWVPIMRHIRPQNLRSRESPNARIRGLRGSPSKSSFRADHSDIIAHSTRRRRAPEVVPLFPRLKLPQRRAEANVQRHDTAIRQPSHRVVVAHLIGGDAGNPAGGRVEDGRRIKPGVPRLERIQEPPVGVQSVGGQWKTTQRDGAACHDLLLGAAVSVGTGRHAEQSELRAFGHADHKLAAGRVRSDAVPVRLMLVSSWRLAPAQPSPAPCAAGALQAPDQRRSSRCVA